MCSEGGKLGKARRTVFHQGNVRPSQGQRGPMEMETPGQGGCRKGAQVRGGMAGSEHAHSSRGETGGHRR